MASRLARQWRGARMIFYRNSLRIPGALLLSLLFSCALPGQQKTAPARFLRAVLSAEPAALPQTVAQASRGDAVITFRKVFKSSYPEFVEFKVGQSGSGTFDIRQLDDDASPQPFEMGAPLAQNIFDLADKLHDFQGVDLEVHR